ncbi:MAG: chemotaxis protein CheB [Elusimicrobiales bacterium]|nr:chemotaxis protein CheB [Elusimicrobiales bacterium]
MKKIINSKAFPVAAIGASAGGLKAFSDLLGALPPEPGMAFVIVPHLAPQYKSHLAEILARNTRLPVSEVKNGDLVLPNRIYILPPNRSMLMKGGALHLSSFGHKADWRSPIDSFFRSLAADQGKNAIGVLLSGEGEDGTDGLKAIKESGGKTFAQDEKTASHLSMPHTAVVSGHVDFVLSPAEIGRKLCLPRGQGRYPEERGVKGKPTEEESLAGILELLRTAKGVEFDLYKRNTLRRRIQRRMTLKGLRDLGKYFHILKGDSKEVGELYADILICVTSFFREPESFKALKHTIYPRLLKNRASAAPIRIWVPGCSTGEEAYSHAINLVEFLGPRVAQVPFQIFATDVNPAVIDKARAGLYSKKIRANVSPERLRRFFTETKDGYRIVPAIRERCIFAAKNLVQDPPFTNVDLISCRNLLIYLGATLQEKAMQIFQYALKPGGILMLGHSETTGDFFGGFSILKAKKNVFCERTSPSKMPLDFSQSGRFLETESAFKSPEREGPDRPTQDALDLQGGLEGVLPARYIPNGVVVNGDLEILRFLGNTSSYLRPAPGKPSMNLRRMVPGGLLLELRTSIHVAKNSACAVRKEIEMIQPGAAHRRVQLEVLPVNSASLNQEYFLILFEEIAAAEPGKPRASAVPGGKESRRVIELKEDLAVSGEHLKAIIEEQESTNARLKASNEELLSGNEELQSVNEEFETAKEELQSTNEELITSTEELGDANQVLNRANSDFSNLLANIDIPIVLLDSDLSIRRFTPPAEKALDLSQDKIGRSIAEIRLPLLIPDLKKMILNVIGNGHVHKQEIRDTEGRWYYLIIRPYRTDKNKIEKSKTDGVVLALIDIQDRKLAEKNVLRLATVVLDSNDSVIIVDMDGRITAWNRGAQKMYGYTEAEALGMNISRLIPKKLKIKTRELARVSAAPMETQRLAKDGRILDVQLTVTVLRDEDGRPVEVAKTERDITGQKSAERERKLSEKNVLRLANSVLDSNDAVIICDLKDQILAWNKGAQKMYGYTEAEALSMSIKRLMPENKLIKAKELVKVSAAPIETQRLTRGGRILDVLLTVTVLRDEKGQAVEVATTERDITEQKRADRELRGLHSRSISAQETERKRLSRELHDGVGQILSGVKFRLESLPAEISLQGKDAEKIIKVGGLLSQAISEIRRVSQNLMPSELVDLGLEPALRTLCREFKERAGVPVTLQAGNVPTDVAPALELALFRIAQEALNNIGKHSKASMAAVKLSRKGKELVLTVSDNGIGFTLGGKRQPAGRGIGLGSMRERSELLGGSLELNSKPGAGTTLVVRVPLSGPKG